MKLRGLVDFNFTFIDTFISYIITVVDGIAYLHHTGLFMSKESMSDNLDQCIKDGLDHGHILCYKVTNDTFHKFSFSPSLCCVINQLLPNACVCYNDIYFDIYSKSGYRRLINNNSFVEVVLSLIYTKTIYSARTPIASKA